MISVGATIAGIVLIQLANGFLGTLVSMRTATAGFSAIVTGVVLASYFGGYSVGAATVAPILQRVGHIRLFAGFAGLVAASIVLQPIFTSAPAWILIRAITGFGCAGLFIAAESWLNSTSTPQNRGSIFAIYMVATNAAFGAGQFLINLPAPNGFELFSLAAALFCVALVPVSLTRAAAPKLVPSPRLRLRELRQVAPVAMGGCVAAGLATSAFYSLVPAYAHSQGTPTSLVSIYMAMAIFGGLAFQIPVGKLSDRFDRRIVAVCLAAGVCLAALTLVLIPRDFAFAVVLTFVLGGCMSTIYPVCVAHAYDRVDPDKSVSVSGQLILLNGIASFAGPIIGTTVMGRGGIAGVFVYIATVAVLFIVVAGLRSFRVAAPKHKERPFVILTERIGQPIAHVAEDETVTGSS